MAAALSRQLLDDHAAGSANGADAIWSLLNLELWYRTFIDGEAIQVLPQFRAAPSASAEARQAVA